MTQLRCCDGCARHVRTTEHSCPFCRRALTPWLDKPLQQWPTGMSRAQRLTLVAAMAGGQMLAGCADNSNVLYGAPIAGNAAGGAGHAAGTGGKIDPHAGAGGQVVVPLYGAPIAGQTSK
jgi:hypothetical protein